MAIGTDKTIATNYDRGNPTFVSTLVGPYVSAIDAGGLASADASPISTPTASITAESRHIITIEPWQGTNLVFSAYYDAAATLPAGGTYVVFGRYVASGVTGAWRRLTNRSGATARSPAFDVTNDASDGTLKYTTPDPNNDVFDRLGNNQILVGIESAHTVGSGSTALAGLMVSIV